MTKHKEKKCKCKWPNGAILKGITERGGWLCSKCGEEIKEPIKMPDLRSVFSKVTEPVIAFNNACDNLSEAKTNNWS